jgi:hypothetical protein
MYVLLVCAVSFDSLPVKVCVHHKPHKLCIHITNPVMSFNPITSSGTYHTLFSCIIKRSGIYFCVKYAFLTGTNACSCWILCTVSHVSNLHLLSVHFLSQRQTWIYVYWNEPIHSADVVSLFDHMIAANLLFLQAFLKCSNPITNSLHMGWY